MELIKICDAFNAYITPPFIFAVELTIADVPSSTSDPKGLFMYIEPPFPRVELILVREVVPKKEID